MQLYIGLHNLNKAFLVYSDPIRTWNQARQVIETRAVRLRRKGCVGPDIGGRYLRSRNRQPLRVRDPPADRGSLSLRERCNRGQKAHQR